MTELTPANLAFYGTDAVSVWQGIRPLDATNYLIVGTQAPNTGILYIGPLDSSSQSIYAVNYPNATSTSVYGPDDAGNGLVQLVGIYKNGTNVVYGFLYKGTVQQLTNPAHYKSISVEGNKFTYLHSVMGDLLVGNCDNPLQYGQFNLPLGPGNAFIYNIKKQTFDFVVFPHSISNTVYGIWQNNEHSYTICGGYANTPVSIDDIYTNENAPKSIGYGFVADYHSKLRKFSNWTSFTYPKNNFITHFQGISSQINSQGKYYQLIADATSLGGGVGPEASWVLIHRKNKHFKAKKWIQIIYPQATTLISGNSVAESAVVGVAVIGDTATAYQAKLIGVEQSS